MIERSKGLLLAFAGAAPDAECRDMADRLTTGARAADAIVAALPIEEHSPRRLHVSWVAGTTAAVLFASIGGTLGARAVNQGLQLSWDLLSWLPLMAAPLALLGLTYALWVDRRLAEDRDGMGAARLLAGLLRAGERPEDAVAVAAYVHGILPEELAEVVQGERPRVGAAAHRYFVEAAALPPRRRQLAAALIGAAGILAVIAFWTIYAVGVAQGVAEAWW